MQVEAWSLIYEKTLWMAARPQRLRAGLIHGQHLVVLLRCFEHDATPTPRHLPSKARRPDASGWPHYYACGSAGGPSPAPLGIVAWTRQQGFVAQCDRRRSVMQARNSARARANHPWD